MKSEIAGTKVPVAIIGGGFSGTMVAANLARRGIASTLIEGGGRLARGIAYSTSEPMHLLNVRAAMMSAWPDDPGDFARRFEEVGGSAHDFAERRFFGRYLGDICADATSTGLITKLSAQAVNAQRTRGAWRVSFEGAESVVASALVLANGNQLPATMRIADGISEQRFINDPWGDAASAAVRQLATSHETALILGTGLTMIDMVLSLHASGHKGSIIALSRRGQVPRSHADFVASPVPEQELPQANMIELWRWLRRRSSQVGWRAAVDALRPHSQTLWQALPDAEQARFLRHVRPWWDVHRHRIAPQVAALVHELVAEGRLEIVAGRLTAIVESAKGLEVAFDRRRGRRETVCVATAFNCTGPLGEMARTKDALLRQLIDDKLVAIDRLGIGLDVDRDNRAGNQIWAVGPLTKGRYWEIVAVPDIRDQAAAVAADIATELTK